MAHTREAVAWDDMSDSNWRVSRETRAARYAAVAEAYAERYGEPAPGETAARVARTRERASATVTRTPGRDRLALVPRDPGSFDDEPRPGVVGGVPGRRTVAIRGQGSLRPAAGPQRRPERPRELAGASPDRVAMWAVLLGVLLIVVALTSAHAIAL